MIDMQVKVDASDAIRAFERLDDPKLTEDMATYVAEQVVLPKLAQYPSPSRKKQPFVSDKARRYFFAALRSGQIRVPYQRSGDLGSKWQRLPFAHGILLQSGMDYSEIVIGENQGAYFKGTWRSITQTATDLETDAGLAATAFLVEKIGDAGP